MKGNKYKRLSWSSSGKAKGKSGVNSPDYPFYNSWKWRKFSKARIKRNPICECDECAVSSSPELADMTDHIIPIQQGGAKMDEMNLQSMSKLKCHQEKRSREARNIFEPHTLNADGDKISKQKYLRLNSEI